MKRNKNVSQANKSVKPAEVKGPDADQNVKPGSLDDEEQGFGGWLRSADGLENMKLFVIANSIVMLTTLVYPHLQTVSQIISEMIYGDEYDI